MKQVFAAASLLALACALAQPAWAQLEDKPVPMDKAPFHIPVFSNEHIILMKINIPPGATRAFTPITPTRCP